MQYNHTPFIKSEELKKLEEKANSYGTYPEGQSVIDARNSLKTHEENKPSDWNSVTEGQEYMAAYNAYKNRPAFSYDLNGDALYQQYKDKYINQGRLAMADTMGQAAAMTGGYGSSYAVTAGNQAYQSQLQNLNDIVPQLYQMAYDRYSQEGQDLMNQYSLAKDIYNTKYGEHRDKVSDYNTELARLTDFYNNERAFYRGAWESDRTYDQTAAKNAYDREYGAWQDTQNRLYQSVRDQVADYQWSKTYEQKTSGGDEDKLSLGDRAKIEEKCENYAIDGNTDGLKAYLKSLYNEGYITKDQYANLYEQYIPIKAEDPAFAGGGSNIVHALN